MRKKRNKITACIIAASMCLAMPAELGWCLTVNAENEETEWNGHTYQYFNTGMTWDEAETYCEALGGHLANITSEEENQVVADLIFGGGKLNYWIGGHLVGDEWLWVPDGAQMTYDNWGSGEPNQSDGLEDALMMWSANGQWNDLPRSGIANDAGYESQYNQSVLGFVCEWDEESSASLQVTIGGGSKYLMGEYADVPLTITGNIPDDAWITFVPSDVPHNEKDGDDANESGKYQRLKDVENGIAHFEAPSKTGAYDIRVYDGDDPDTAREIAYKTVEIVYADMTASVRVDSNVIKPGEEIRVYVEYSGLVRDDAWVGFIPSDVAHTEKDSDDHNGDWGWVYEADETGYVLITAPTRTGTWDIRLFDGDGAYAKEVTYITVTVSEDAEPVESGSKTTWNGHTYQYFNTGMSWDEAEAYCEALGGHLANITSEEENQVVADLISGGGKLNYWIGGHLVGDAWVWVPDDAALTYNEWGSGEPNQSDGLEDALMMWSANGQWNDLPRSGIANGASYEYMYNLSVLGFVCEWDEDVPQGLTRSAFERIEAEDYQDASQRVHSADNYGTGTCIGWIADGYYIAYEDIDFGTGAKSAIISASNYYDCVIEIRLDGIDGKLIGTCNIPGIANWNNFSEYTCNISSVSGVHDVYLVCRADTTVDVTNLDYFTFSKKSAAETPTEPPTTEPPTTEPADAKEMPGDVNLDGTVDIMDVISINRYLLGSMKLGPVAKQNADVDGTNAIDTTDSLMILKYVVEIIDGFGSEPTQPTDPPTGSSVDFTGVSITQYQQRVPANSNAFVELSLSGKPDLSGSSAWVGLIPVGTGLTELEADAVDLSYTYLRDATYIEDDHISVGVFIPQGLTPGEYELRVYTDDNSGALVDRVTITVIEENTLTFRRDEIGWYKNDDSVPCLTISFDYTGEIFKGDRVRIMFVPADTPHDDWASVNGMGGVWAADLKSAGGDYTSTSLPDKTEGAWEMRAYTDVFNGARELDSMPIPAYDLD